MTTMKFQTVLANIPATQTSEGLAKYLSSRDTESPPETAKTTNMITLNSFVKSDFIINAKLLAQCYLLILFLC